MAAARKPDTKYIMVSARVDEHLKKRIEAHAAEYNLSLSEAVRSLLAFAVTEGEDPRTRVLYATYADLRLQALRLLKEGMVNGLSMMNSWLADTLRKEVGVQ